MQVDKLVIAGSTVGEDGTRVLKLSGPMVITNLFEFQDAVRAETSPLLILDLTEVPYMDSAALGSVVSAHISCVNGKRRLALAGVTDRVATLMKVTNVHRVLPMYSTVADAISAYGPPAP
ncbi:MAG: STAS domain-containing protein [Terriglobia bacterium]